MKNIEEIRLDKIRGCLVGGAVGDALGYTIEFCGEEEIFSKYGSTGITKYRYDKSTGKALISDDTQMTLFTANGLLVGDTRGKVHGIQGLPRVYVAEAYQDWLRTQEYSYEENKDRKKGLFQGCCTWLSDVPTLYALRAPGNTCLSALKMQEENHKYIQDYIKTPQNFSKGCGGVMRVAPLALNYHDIDIELLDIEGAQLAAITHGHSLGYMPAAILTHIINRIVYPEKEMTLKEIVIEAKETTKKLFKNDKYLQTLINIIDLAMELHENNDSDVDNIHRIGEGWVAEEALGIAIYCALRYQNDFSAGIIASVNHKGDSDSTGSITGNILGAWLGVDAIEVKWKTNLELIEVILEISNDLCYDNQNISIDRIRK